MKTPFEKILNQESLVDVMRSAAETNQQDLEEAALGLDDNQFTQFGIISSRIIRARGLEKTLREGCIFHLYRLATAPEKRLEMFEKLLEDVGVSRTQAFRSIAAWQRCGTLFMSETGLSTKFVAESVKLLGESGTSEQTFNAAIELARKGERVSILRVRQLQAKYPTETSVDAESGPAARQKKQKPAPPEKLVQTFVSRLAKVIRTSSHPIAKEEVDSMILRLEEVIAALREQQAKLAIPVQTGEV